MIINKIKEKNILHSQYYNIMSATADNCKQDTDGLLCPPLLIIASKIQMV
jgi:hypothetical protein